jgi:hypothetical protein
MSTTEELPCPACGEPVTTIGGPMAASRVMNESGGWDVTSRVVERTKCVCGARLERDNLPDEGWRLVV